VRGEERGRHGPVADGVVRRGRGELGRVECVLIEALKPREGLDEQVRARGGVDGGGEDGCEQREVRFAGSNVHRE
jgi:hypothetical protein